MSGQYDNTNSGALFRNDRKTSNSHPDFRGSVNVNGQEFWVSAWLKAPRAGGDKFLSLALTPKDEQRTHTRTAPVKDAGLDDFLEGASDKVAQHKARHSDAKGDMPSRGPSQPPRDASNRNQHANDNLQAQDFDAFDDDIPF